jgi:hypothetical protein
VRKAICRLSARAGDTVKISNNAAVGDEFWLRPVAKPCNVTSDGYDLSSALTLPSCSRRDKKAKNPNSTLVGVASLCSLEHRPFGGAPYLRQLHAQVSIQIPNLGAGCHRGKIGLQDSRGLRHQFERKVVVRSRATPIDEAGFRRKLCLSD